MTLVRGSRAVVILVSVGEVVILVPVTVMINPFDEWVPHERSGRMSAPSHLVLEVTLGASALTWKTRLRWPQQRLRASTDARCRPRSTLRA
jgi:hypothetical protein